MINPDMAFWVELDTNQPNLTENDSNSLKIREILIDLANIQINIFFSKWKISRYAKLLTKKT
jgi:hypothetical protein